VLPSVCIHKYMFHAVLCSTIRQPVPPRNHTARCGVVATPGGAARARGDMQSAQALATGCVAWVAAFAYCVKALGKMMEELKSVEETIYSNLQQFSLVPFTGPNPN